MRIYSDRLTGADLGTAMRRANELRPAEPGERFGSTDGRIGFERCERIGRPRIRQNGWDILLFRVGSSMHFNTGRYGAGEEGAASWDDWGWFLAALFELDPDADVPGAGYDGVADFNRQTRDAFRAAGGSPRMLTAKTRDRLVAIGYDKAEANQILAVARRTYTPAYTVRSGAGQRYAVHFSHGRFQVTKAAS